MAEEESPTKIINEVVEDEPVKEDEPELKTETLDANEEFKVEVMEVFDMFDKDKDFTIEIASLATMLRWLKFNPTEKELHQYQLTFDPNSVGRYRIRDVL